MAAITDRLLQLTAPLFGGVQATSAPAAKPATFGTDRLSSDAGQRLAAPIHYDVQLDGRSSQQWMQQLHGKHHAHDRSPKPITEAEVRAKIADITHRAQHLKNDRDLAKLGYEAQDLLDRVNATAVGQLNDAARQAAARAIVPLAQAGELDDLACQAQSLLTSGSASDRALGLDFMHQEGANLQSQADALDVPQAAHAVLTQRIMTVQAIQMQIDIAAAMREFDREDALQDAKFQAARAASWAAYNHRAGEIAQVQVSDRKVEDRRTAPKP